MVPRPRMGNHFQDCCLIGASFILVHALLAAHGFLDTTSSSILSFNVRLGAGLIPVLPHRLASGFLDTTSSPLILLWGIPLAH